MSVKAPRTRPGSLFAAKVAKHPAEGSQRLHDGLQRACVEYARRKHRIDLWHNDSKAVRVGRAWVSRVVAGWPDLCCLLPPHGRFCAVEVKTGKSRLNPSQMEMRISMLTSGAVWITARDINQFAAEFDAAIKAEKGDR